MGLFDFFKKKSSEGSKSEAQETTPVDSNSYLLGTLRHRLIRLGYQVEIHPKYFALIVNAEMEVATVIIDNPDSHQSILHLMISTSHPKYFPDGIIENIVGFGTTLEEKVNSVLDNFINTTFLTIIESFSDGHNPELDFFTTINGEEILWHPKLGNLTLQGQWSQHPEGEPLFEIVKNNLSSKLTSSKLQWLKIYMMKQVDGTIGGECLFNNEPWDEGLAGLKEYAKSWRLISSFQGIKQFIMFRKCDAYDK